MTMLIPIRDANPYRRFPLVTVAFIAINVWVFFAIPPTDQNVYEWGAIPCDVLSRCDALSARLEAEFASRSPLVTVFSSMFMHGNLAHLGGNMLYFWVFGNNIEDRLGHVRFTIFYFACGLVGAAAHFAVSSSSGVPIVGASGAVSGILGAYLVLFPKARVLTLVPFLFFLPVEVTASTLLGFWFLGQLLAGVAGLGASQGPGVAFFAHIGGFVAGWLFVRFRAAERRRDPVERWVRYE